MSCGRLLTLHVVVCGGSRLAYAEALAANDAAVEPRLADQSLLPMAVTWAGSFATLGLTTYATTDIDIIRPFRDLPITVCESGADLCAVRIGYA